MARHGYSLTIVDKAKNLAKILSFNFKSSQAWALISQLYLKVLKDTVDCMES
jgi:hypothetical protein